MLVAGGTNRHFAYANSHIRPLLRTTVLPSISFDCVEMWQLFGEELPESASDRPIPGLNPGTLAVRGRL